jgi:hypothetical protein
MSTEHRAEIKKWLSTEEDLEHLFRTLDVNGDGLVSAEELVVLVDTATLSEGACEAMLTMADSDGDGYASLAEFYKFAHTLQEIEMLKAELDGAPQPPRAVEQKFSTAQLPGPQNMVGWTARWKWADTGLLSGTGKMAMGLKVLSSFNPMRWSSFKTLPEMVRELRGESRKSKHSGSPVLVGFKPPAGTVIDASYGGRTCESMAMYRTYGTARDAAQKLMDGPSGAGLPRSVYNHAGYQYRETPGGESIICPGLRCMYNCGILNVPADGFCTREDLMQAQQACGMDSPLMNVESTEAAKPGIYVMRQLDSPAAGHEKALRVCVDTPVPSHSCPIKMTNWSELADFAKNGRFTVDEFRELYRYVWRTKETNAGK